MSEDVFLYIYIYTQTQIHILLFNEQKNEENIKKKVKSIVSKKITAILRSIPVTCIHFLWLYTNEQLQRIKAWILIHSPKLPSKHKIVNPSYHKYVEV